MPAKRRWKTWPGKFAGQLNVASGVASLGGALLAGVSFLGLTAMSGGVAAVTGGLGLLITAGAVGVAGYKSIPPKSRRPEEFVGQTVSLELLEAFDPPLRTLSVIGAEKSGKSTLLSMILTKEPPDEEARTQEVVAYVAALQQSGKYIALLDGPGRSYTAQFKVMNPADMICLVLDHNAKSDEATIDEARLKLHKEFSLQMRDNLSTRHLRRKSSLVHIIMNKHDLWINMTAAQQKKLKELLATEEEEWKKTGCAQMFSSGLHSNKWAEDVGKLLRLINATTAQG